jgi:hypothetical protein
MPSTELQRISVVDEVHADTMSRCPTQFSTQPLPFYPAHKLLVADITLPHREMRLLYADDGKTVVPIDGTAKSVYSLNRVAKLNLSASTVGDYFKFFVRNGMRSAKAQVIETIDDASLRESATAAERQQIAKVLRPMKIETHPEGGFVISACLLEGQAVFETTSRVHRNGEVVEQGRTRIFADAPVAETF